MHHRKPYGPDLKHKQVQGQKREPEKDLVEKENLISYSQEKRPVVQEKHNSPSKTRDLLTVIFRMRPRNRRTNIFNTFSTGRRKGVAGPLPGPSSDRGPAEVIAAAL